jgi:exonuclease III
MATLNITSYNCHGVFNSCMYIQMLLNSSDVLCIQEHYMCEDYVNFLHTMSSNHRCFARCASYYDDNDIMVRKGGVAIFWKMDLNCVVTKLDDIDNDRIIGIKILQHDVKALCVFNVYLPSSNYTYVWYNLLSWLLITKHVVKW